MKYERRYGSTTLSDKPWGVKPAHGSVQMHVNQDTALEGHVDGHDVLWLAVGDRDYRPDGVWHVLLFLDRSALSRLRTVLREMDRELNRVSPPSIFERLRLWLQ